MKRAPYRKPVPKPVVKKHGPNWKLFAHLIIIAVLLYAISIAWQNLGKAQAKREAEIRQAAAKRAQASDESRAEAQRQAAERITRAPRTPAEFSGDDIMPSPADTPRESLQRLKDGMLAGDRRDTSGGSLNQDDGPPEKNTRTARTDDSPQSGDDSAAGPEFAALKERAQELVTAAGRKHKEQLSENIRTLEWNLDNWVRGLVKSEQAAWRPQVTQLKEASSHGRVPSSISDSSGIRLSTKMEELARAAAARQKEIDNEFFSTTGTIHRAYLAKIRSSITDAENSGQSGTAGALRRASDSATDFDSWLKSLGVDSPTAEASNQRE